MTPVPHGTGELYGDISMLYITELESIDELKKRLTGLKKRLTGGNLATDHNRQHVFFRAGSGGIWSYELKVGEGLIVTTTPPRRFTATVQRPTIDTFEVYDLPRVGGLDNEL